MSRFDSAFKEKGKRAKNAIKSSFKLELITQIDELAPDNQVFRVATWLKGWFIVDYNEEIRKINEQIFELEKQKVGGGSRSSFWINLLASVLNRNLHVCEQSEYGAALGVARLAMFVDNEIAEKENIIKKIKINKDYFPKDNFLNILQKRYQIWKNYLFK